MFKDYKGVINISMVHNWLFSADKQLVFIESYEDISQHRPQRAAHSNSVNLSVHAVIETEFHVHCSHVQHCTTYMLRNVWWNNIAMVQMVYADVNDLL